jgi:Zn finger protein HypA/HybF involved in hydrogenase expression
MKTPKTLFVIECRKCGGSYFGDDKKLVLNPGSEHEQPDEISFTIRKVAKCPTCKEHDDRTKNGSGRRYDYD